MQSSDKDLLLLAAKAAGLTLVLSSYYGRYTGEREIFRVGDSNGLPWDPLEKDGEAFRLAVQLAMFNGSMMFHFRSLERFGNPQASELECTRRAIVRTAAEIGRTM